MSASQAICCAVLSNVVKGSFPGFTKRYGLKRLVYCEHHDDIRYAIQREKTIKHWPRAWKVRLIHSMNMEWEDLYETLI